MIKAKVEEIKKKMDINVQVRTRSKEAIQSKTQQLKQLNKATGDKIREEKESSKNAIAIAKEQTQNKKNQMYRTIKDQQNELKDKKEQSLMNVVSTSKRQIAEKIAYENELMKESELEIAELEREELEVIQRLQNTQVQQKCALSDLENILSHSRHKTPETYNPKSANSNGKKH